MAFTSMLPAKRQRRAQVVRRLQGDLPVWVRGDAWETAGEELDDIFIGDAEIWCDPFVSRGLVCTGTRLAGHRSGIGYTGPHVYLSITSASIGAAHALVVACRVVLPILHGAECGEVNCHVKTACNAGGGALLPGPTRAANRIRTPARPERTSWTSVSVRMLASSSSCPLCLPAACNACKCACHKADVRAACSQACLWWSLLRKPA